MIGWNGPSSQRGLGISHAGSRRPQCGSSSIATGFPSLILKCDCNSKLRPKTPRRKDFLRTFFLWFGLGVVALWLLAALMLVAAQWIDPPTTAVHIERRWQAWIH